MKKTIFEITKMDCPSEENIYRKYLNDCKANDTVEKNYEKIEIALADYVPIL